MKKILLIAVFACGVFALQAQNLKKAVDAPRLAKGLQIENINLDAEPVSTFPFKPYNDYTNAKGIQSITKVNLGSSANPYSILLHSQKCLTYNEELDMIMFTHRQDHTNPGNSGYIQATFSTDGGLNWDNNIVYQDAAKLGRYPSGVIYNPTGNTNSDDAFSVVSGPFTGGSGWLGTFFSSMQFDGSNGDTYVIDEDENLVPYTNLVRNFIQVDTEGRIRIYGEKNTDDGTYYTGYNTAIYTGAFDNTLETWSWTESNIIPDFSVGANSNPSGYRTPGMAWSKDGEIGYMVYIGRNVNAIDPDAYHPMIYKTDDAGVTWTLLPGFDWSAIPAINDELTATQNDPTVYRAIFGLIEDAIVDADGHLHFATYVNSAWSTHPDSLGYMYGWQGIEGMMYHMWQTATGWDADVIDIQWAKDVDEANSTVPGVGGPNLTWDNRLQMSKTPNEDLIVFAWMDTDEIFSDYNLYPDILTQVYNINTGGRTATKNITEGTTYDAFNHFLYLSNWSGYDAATDNVILHMTTSEFGTNDLDPVYHYYVKGAQIFANINENTAGNDNLSFVSQNYPNPFNGTTSIDITLNNSSNVSVEVFNMLGQKVNGISTSLTAGTHTLTISAENLKTGIYFYTVRAGEYAVTHKMIVK